MRIFLSWSGKISHELALALHRWLPEVVQGIQPWVSGENIDPGERWSQILTAELESTACGILCITPENVDAPWLLFEAGALGRSPAHDRVIPLLLGVTPEDLTGPLAQFQMLNADRRGIELLVKSLHRLSASNIAERQQKRLFEARWPTISERLSDITTRLFRSEALTSPRDADSKILAEIAVLRTQLILQLSYVDLNTPRSHDEKAAGLKDRARVTLQEHIERLEAASKALTQNVRSDRPPFGSEAWERGGLSYGRIDWLADLIKLIHHFHSELEQRIFWLKNRSAIGSESWRRVNHELRIVEELLAAMPVLTAPRDDRSS